MKIGTIFIWRKYPYLEHEANPKDAWCIYFGESDYFDDPKFVIFHKLTSLKHFYDKGGAREKNNHHVFYSRDNDFLAKDSIIDFSFRPEYIEKLLFESATIEILCELPDDKVRFLYNKIKHPSCGYEYKIKCRIRESLNNEGYDGLDKPKRDIRRPY